MVIQPLLRQPRLRDMGRRLFVACGGLFHLSIVILWITGKANFHHRSRYEWLEAASVNGLWPYLHLLAAILLLVVAVRNPKPGWYIGVLSPSSGIMGAWSSLTLMWGLTITDGEASLIGPVFGMIVSLAGYFLALSFAGSRG